MTFDEFAHHCRQLKGHTEEILWEDHLVFKVGGKMFAVMGDAAAGNVSTKVDPVLFHDLTQVPGVIPAPYLARAHWVQIQLGTCGFSDSQIQELAHASYALVVQKLSKKIQRSLQAS